jgi:hypothetical protein
LREILFKIANTFTENFQMLKQAYGEDCLSRTQCYKWYQRLNSGRTFTEDDSKTRRPFTLTDADRVEKVLAFICENRRLTVREVPEGVDVTNCSCHTILTKKLEMHRFSAKFVPRLVTDEQKSEPCHSQSGAVGSVKC